MALGAPVEFSSLPGSSAWWCNSKSSIARNLPRTMLRAEALPREWLEPLELREVITEIANDLYDFPDWGIGHDSSDPELHRRVWDKYPAT
jgi:hypothetical protein